MATAKLLTTLLVAATAQRDCACDPSLGLACAEARIAPWERDWRDLRCDLRCCAEAATRALGWDAAVAAMKVGERARILIAPEHGYGERGAGGAIPPDSWLLFDVEVLSAEADPEPAFSTPSLLALICVEINHRSGVASMA